MEELTSKKVLAAIAAEKATISAPVAGIFLLPETAPTQLAENDAYGRIVAPTFRAVTKEPLVTEARTGTFTGPAGKIDVTLDHGAAGVTASIDGQLKWLGAKGTLELAAGRTPWILSALR